NEAPPGVRTFRPDAPTGLEQVITRCLEKDTALRFQNVGELALALQPFGTARARISVDGILGTLRNTVGPARAAAPTKGLSGLSTPTETARELPTHPPAVAHSAPQPALGATTAQAVAS